MPVSEEWNVFSPCGRMRLRKAVCWPPVRAAFCSAMAMLCAAGAAAAEKVWTAPASGNWSDNANWLDGSAPPAGGDPSLSLLFNPVGQAGVTATNDYPGAFALSNLRLDNRSAGTLTLAGATGSSLNFSGEKPTIQLLGMGAVNVTSPITLAPEAGGVTITGPGAGNLTLSGSISTVGPSQTLTIAGGAASPNGQVVTLAAANTISGGVILQAGNLRLAHSGALGSGPLAVHGGKVSFASSSASINTPVLLHSDLVISSTAGGLISGSISSAAPGTGLTVRHYGSEVTLTRAAAYTGKTIIDYPLWTPQPWLSAGALRLTSTASLYNTSGIEVRGGGTLSLRDGSGDRIGNNVPVLLRNGIIDMIYGGAEVIGVLSGAGYSTVTGHAGSLTAAALARVERGTFYFSGTLLGASPSLFQITFTSPPGGLVGGGSTGPNTSILPYAIGDTKSQTAGISFVTYSPTSGVRPLDPATEYASTLSTSTVDNNVRLTTATTQSAPISINSLFLASGGSVSGMGAVTVRSGAILTSGSSTSSATISTPLAFGAAEANFFCMTALDVSGLISGSGGLTKSGDGRLSLINRNNTFTGPLTINSGVVAFSTPGSLGLDTSPIVLNGQNAGLTYTGSSIDTLARSIELRNGMGRLAASGGGRLTISGIISGDGGIRLRSDSTATVRLTASNTYSGPTLLQTGTLEISSDTALGAGGALHFGGGTLTLAGNWVTQREIVTEEFVTPVINMGAHTISWSRVASFTGDIRGTGGVTWSPMPFGAESAVKSSVTYTGPTTVAGERGPYPTTLSFTGSGAARGSSEFKVNGSGVLKLDNTAAPLNRIGAVPVTLNGSSLVLIGSSEAALTQSAGVLRAIGTGIVRIDATGGRRSTTLALAGIERRERGTFVFSSGSTSAVGRVGDGLSNVTVGSDLSNLLVGSGADSASILPFAISDADFVTYDAARGIRPLNPEEYSFTLGGGGNVQLSSGSFTNNEEFAMNSLNLRGASLVGTGAISVGSGAVLVTSSAVTIQNHLAFGTREANFWTVGADLALAGGVSGSNGLTKSGLNGLSLTAANALTGPVTINSGTLIFSRMDQLGTDASEIVINEATLRYSPPITGTALTLTRGIRMNAASWGTIATSSEMSSLTIGAPITGPGGVEISGRVIFPKDNFYDGATKLSGVLEINSDASLGNGRSVVFSFGSLVLRGRWDTIRDLEFAGGGTIDTAGFDGVIEGRLLGSSVFSKTGPGLLTIRDASDFTGYSIVNGGVLAVSGAIGGSSGVQVNEGGLLTGDLITAGPISVSGALSPGSGVGAMNTGSLFLSYPSTLMLEIASPALFDRVSVTGNVRLGGAVNLQLDLRYDPADNIDSFMVIANDGSDPIELGNGGRFSYEGHALDEGGLFAVGSQQFRISYSGGSGNDVVLYAVPEPVSTSLVAGGGLLLGCARRRLAGR